MDWSNNVQGTQPVISAVVGSTPVDTTVPGDTELNINYTCDLEPTQSQSVIVDPFVLFGRQSGCEIQVPVSRFWGVPSTSSKQ